MYGDGKLTYDFFFLFLFYFLFILFYYFCFIFSFFIFFILFLFSFSSFFVLLFLLFFFHLYFFSFCFCFHLVHFHSLLFLIVSFFSMQFCFLKCNQMKTTWLRADVAPKINHDGWGLTYTNPAVACQMKRCKKITYFNYATCKARKQVLLFIKKHGTRLALFLCHQHLKRPPQKLIFYTMKSE